MRLDKYLAHMSVGTRSEVKKFIKSGRVFVNDVPAEKPELQVGEKDVVFVDGKEISYVEYEYFMLNKPSGVVSATRDRKMPTVVSLIKESCRTDLFPVGRLDKDTEGLLLITNDGALAHALLSPARHVWKTYLVKADESVGQEDVKRLEEGLDIGDEKPTMPARVKILSDSVWEEDRQKMCLPEEERQNDRRPVTWLELSVQEGRYHQVKRMLAAVGKPVLYLKRVSMGNLSLDKDLSCGRYRRLTAQEVERLKNDTKTEKRSRNG